MTILPDENSLAYSMAGIRRTNPFDRRRSFASRLMQSGADASPVQHPLQGAARLAQALIGGYLSNRADEDEREATASYQSKLAEAMAQVDPQKRIAALSAVDPSLGARLSGQLAVEQAKIAQQQQGLQTAAGNFGGSFGAPPTPGAPPTGNAQTAISGIESGGRYDAVGPETGKGRALGKYQVMPFNVGPWTKEALGREMTPQEFLANPQAQDAVFNHKFGQYVQQYGSPQAAARAWFAGPGGMNNPNARDALGTSVADYSQKFNAAYGQPGAPPVQVAQGSADGSGNPLPPPGMPPAPQPSAVNGPTMVAPTPPQIPDVPRPQPTPQQIQSYRQRLQSGEFGRDANTAIPAARAAMEAELDRQWVVDRERARMQFDQSQKQYDTDAKRAADGPQKSFDNANKLRDEFNGSPQVKMYREVTPIIESMKEAQTRPSRAADLNLVYALAKIMDPGSVVREGEMVMVNNTQGIGDRLAGLINSLNGGAALTPETRQKVIDEAQSRFKGLEQSYKAIEDHYAGIADRYGIKRDDVIIPIRRGAPQAPVAGPAPQASPGQMPKITGDADYAKLPSGTTFIAPDGTTRVKP